VAPAWWTSAPDQADVQTHQQAVEERLLERVGGDEYGREGGAKMAGGSGQFHHPSFAACRRIASSRLPPAAG